MANYFWSSRQTRGTIFTLIRTRSSLATTLLIVVVVVSSSLSAFVSCASAAAAAAAVAVTAAAAALLDTEGFLRCCYRCFNGCQLEAIHCFDIDGHNGWGHRRHGRPYTKRESGRERREENLMESVSSVSSAGEHRLAATTATTATTTSTTTAAAPAAATTTTVSADTITSVLICLSIDLTAR